MTWASELGRGGVVHDSSCIIHCTDQLIPRMELVTVEQSLLLCLVILLSGIAHLHILMISSKYRNAMIKHNI